MKSMLFLCLGLSIATTIHAQDPYILDPYFGNSGVNIGGNPPWGNNPYRTYNVKNMAIASDDKIIVAGNQVPGFSPLGISGGHFAVSRMKADGSVDSSFAGTGHKVFQSGVDGAPLLTLDILKILPDNKLFYAGTQMTNPISKYVVFKMNTNGSFDNTFGTNGRAVISSGSGMWQSLDAMGIQSTGKLLLLGSNGDNSTPWVGSIARLNSNGTLDNSFGTNGILTPNYGFIDNNVLYGMIKVLNDNSFLVAGTHVQSTMTTEIRQDFVAKFDANGVLQTNFGTNGKVILPLSNNERLAFRNQDIEVDNSGNIYINCSTNGGSTGTASVLVYKLNGNGTLINNYGPNGRLTVPQLHHDSWYSYDAMLQGDKLLVAGMTDTGLAAPYHLQRFNADGTEDLTFASPLSHIADNRNAYDHLYFLGLQSNDRIMLGGNGKRDDKAADSIFPVILRFLERGTEQPPVDTGTSVVNIKDQDQVKIFPNPVNNVLYIRGVKSNTEARFYDVSGKLVLSTLITDKNSGTVDCSPLPPGIYGLYLKEANSKTIYAYKLLKQ